MHQYTYPVHLVRYKFILLVCCASRRGQYLDALPAIHDGALVSLCYSARSPLFHEEDHIGSKVARVMAREGDVEQEEGEMKQREEVHSYNTRHDKRNIIENTGHICRNLEADVGDM